MAITRAAMRLMIPNYIRGGASAAQFIRDMQRDYGKAYRKTNVQADFRYFAGIETSKSRVKSVRKDLMPSDAVFAPGKPKRGAKFEWRVEIKGIDSLTGGERKQWVTYLSDDRMSPGDVERAAWVKYSREAEEDLLRASDVLQVMEARVDFGIRRI